MARESATTSVSSAFSRACPKGLRKTLYVKDDDYRLSFEHGNFVTLTNLSEDDWQRCASSA